MANLKVEDIHVVVDANDFKNGENNVVIDKTNIKMPSYIELDSFTPKTLYIKSLGI